MSRSLGGLPRTGRTRALVALALSLAWGLVMGAMAKDDQVVALLQGRPGIVVPQLVLAALLWALTLTLCSYLAGRRRQVLPEGPVQGVALLVAALVLALEPWGLLNGWRDALLQGDVSQMPLVVLAGGLGAVARPLCVVLALWLVLALEGAGAHGAGRARRLSLSRALVASLASAGLTFVLWALLAACLGGYADAVKAAAIQGLVSQAEAPTRLPLWYDFILQVADFASLLPSLLLPALRSSGADQRDEAAARRRHV